MSDPKRCTRCGGHVTGPTELPLDGGAIYRASIRTRTAHVLRFNVWRFTPMAKHAQDQARMTYTELDLCNPCAGAVFDFAQGKEADR